MIQIVKDITLFRSVKFPKGSIVFAPDNMEYDFPPYIKDGVVIPASKGPVYIIIRTTDGENFCDAKIRVGKINLSVSDALDLICQENSGHKTYKEYREHMDKLLYKDF